MREASEEEKDILQRSTKRSKESYDTTDPPIGDLGDTSTESGAPRRSYRDTVIGDASCGHKTQEEEDEEGNTSNNDVVEERDNETWFGMRMTKEEKFEPRKQWRNSLTIKLVERTVGYQYLWKRVQAM